MNSIILCEGSTDFQLLQYYMRKVHQWEDAPRAIQESAFKYKNQNSRVLKRANDTLTIAAVGGCSELTAGLDAVLVRNQLAAPNVSSDVIGKIVIVTDNDDEGTEQSLIEKVNASLCNKRVTVKDEIRNNCWVNCSMAGQTIPQIDFELLILIIPFSENGAMENFLLDAVSAKDSYDGVIIQKCSNFVNTVDPDQKYLKQRRIITKAKFDTYFSVRTPLTQFNERQSILKNVPWEDYEKVQAGFVQLRRI